MKSLTLSCTKNVHFSYNNEIYKQIDVVPMISTFRPVIASIVMVDLETTVLPTFNEHMTP